MPEWKWIPILISVCMAGLSALFITTYFAVGRKDDGPRQAFEAHLLALDEGRVDDANALVDSSCEHVAEEDVQEAGARLESAGLTFGEAFRVAEVWVNESGTEAIIELTSPEGLPKVARLVKVDGEWLVSCDGT